MVLTCVKYDGTQRLREKFLDNEWLHINEETANKKTVNCDKIREFDEQTWKL
jgi:hypothetical protein